MRHFLCIINPISGTRPKTDLKALVRRRVEEAGGRVSFYPSVADGNYDFLEGPIISEGVTDIIIAGGDGTVNAAIYGLKRYGLPFGILPFGSGNGLAFGAGIPQNPARALDIILRGNRAWADALTFNNRFACMLCGFGFDAQVAHEFARDPRRGLMTYMRKIVNHFFSAPTYSFGVELPGNTFSTDAFFISVANSNQFGNHFTIAPRARLTDGLLDVVIMTRQNKLNVLLQTLLQVSGLNRLQQVEMIGEQMGVLYLQTPEVHIRNPEGAPVHLDGEPLETVEEAHIAIQPQSFQLMFPPVGL